MITTERTLAKKIVHFIERNNEGAELNIKNMVHWDLESVIDFMIEELNNKEKDGEYSLEWCPTQR